MDAKTMGSVLPLKFTSRLVCIQALFKHLDEPDSDHLSEYITRLLETDCFTAVSEEILHRIIKYFPKQLDNRLLLALLPAHAKELNLASCNNVRLMGLVNVFKKCSHLQKLNLSGCTQLMVADIFTCMGLMGIPVTTVSLEGNQNVTDDIVQTMIRVLPSLHNLDISCCNKVTDDVFLVEKELQLRRETSKQTLTGELSQYKYQLSSVDISGCGGLTSVAVRHLTSLSGPYLRQISIAFTKIDSTALFSLAGYSFPAVIDFVLHGDEKLLKEKELKEYVADLTEIAKVYGFPVKQNGEVQVGTSENLLRETKSTDMLKESIEMPIVDSEAMNVETYDRADRLDQMKKETAEIESANPNEALDRRPDFQPAGDLVTLNKTEKERHDTSFAEGQINSLDSDSADFVGGTDNEKSQTYADTAASGFSVVHANPQSTNDNIVKTCNDINSGHSDKFVAKSDILDGENTLSYGQESKAVHSQFAEVIGMNNNYNWQDFSGVNIPSSSKSNVSQKPRVSKILGNNLIQNEESSSYFTVQAESDDGEKAISGWSENVIDDIQNSCTECCDMTDLPDNLQVRTGYFQSDLNKNIVCDTFRVDNDTDTHNFTGSQSENLPSNFVVNTDCDSLNSFVTCTLRSSATDSNGKTDVLGEVSLDISRQSLEDHACHFVDHDHAIKMVEQHNLPKYYETCEEDVSCDNRNMSLERNDYDLNPVMQKTCILSERTQNIEEPVCDYGSNSKQKNLKEVDHDDRLLNADCDEVSENCDHCSMIRDKIQSARNNKNTGSLTSDENNVNDTDLEQTSKFDGSQRHEEDSDASLENKLDSIEKTLDHIDKKLDAFTVTDEKTVQLYTPHLTSLNIESIKFPSPLFGKLCLEKFFQLNKELRVFKTNWKGLNENLMKSIVPSLSHLQEIDVEECLWLQNGGVAMIGKSCPDLRKVNLRGVVYIKDMAMVPYFVLSDLTSLDLAESEITDATLIRLANRCSDKLTELDLSWCEEITEKGVNELCTKCSKLEVLTLKKCPVSDITLGLIAENCHQLRNLTIESVEDVTENVLSDVGISDIGQNLRYLQNLDISWNLSITDVSIKVIMSQCVRLEEAYMKGLKQITAEAFLPIIADFPKWQRCQALLKFKKREREYLEERAEAQCSSDEEYESLMIPHRSTSYAPNLRVLDLEYSDLVEDERMMEVVSVCRGSLKVIDYYGQELKPRLFTKK